MFTRCGVMRRLRGILHWAPARRVPGRALFLNWRMPEPRSWRGHGTLRRAALNIDLLADVAEYASAAANIAAE
jgi:hypothetical protein